MLVVDHPLLARKSSLLLFFFGAGVSHLIFSFTSWVLTGSLARLCIKCALQLMFPLTAESFETKRRARGVGFCVGLGKIGSVVMPFGINFLDSWNQSSVYVCFSILSGLACLILGTQVEETLEVRTEVK